MTLRNKKLLSLLLATAMVFTMNTSVFALEVGEGADEEYAVDFVDDSGDFEESEGAAEVDSVETDDFAFVDEIDGLYADSEDGYVDATIPAVASMNALIWELSGKENDLKNNVLVKDSKVKLVSPTDAVTIGGSIDSKPISVQGNTKDKLVISQIEATENSSGSVALTLLSSNEIDNTVNNKTVKSGYWYIKGYPGDNKEKIEAWAKTLVKDSTRVAVEADCSDITKPAGIAEAGYDKSEAKGKIVLTFKFSTEAAQENNVKYGEETKTFGGAQVTYYKNIPFIGGKGTLKTNLDSAFGMKISGNGVTYKIKSISVKFNKGTSTATITKVKLDKSVGTKENRKAIQNALKKAITFTCYPYNIAKGATKVKSKTSGKLMLKVQINGKKITAKDGKSDKYGGTYKLKVSGNKIEVTGSKILCGEL